MEQPGSIDVRTHAMTTFESSLAHPARAWPEVALHVSQILLLCLGGLVAGSAVAAHPRLALALAAGIIVVAVVSVYPVLAAYLIVSVTPLTAGIDRGTLIPVLRPNEALALLVGGALILRWIAQLRSAGSIAFKQNRVAAAIVLLALTSSVIPLFWLRLRGQQVETDDVLYALVIWKFLGVFLIIRGARLTERQAWRCLEISIATAVVIGAIAILQARGFGPAINLLKTYYTTNGNVDALSIARGSSTLSLPIAVADLMIYNLAIVVGLLWSGRRGRALLISSALILVLAVISAGEFSGVIGLTVGLVAVCIAMRSIRALRYLFPGAILAFWVLSPVIETRLKGFQSASGLPVSWSGRLFNLQNYFWPELFSHHNFLLGVRPAARIVAPHRANGFIWIESGYTWLLWAGGIPLLLSFLWFVYIAGRAGLHAARTTDGARQVAGLAAFTAIAVTAVLMIFDPHLTYRGAGDELFTLLALTLPAASRATEPTREGHRHV